MAILTVTQRNNLATAYAAAATHVALSTTVPSGTPGTEVTGGTYARKPANWGTATASAIVASPAAFDVPAGQTVAGVMLYTALAAGTYLDGAAVTLQAFASAGTYTVTATYTQS